jgi:hypothetical protein
MEWTKENRPSFQGDYTAAIQKEIVEYAQAQQPPGEPGGRESKG